MSGIDIGFSIDLLALHAKASATQWEMEDIISNIDPHLHIYLGPQIDSDQKHLKTILVQTYISYIFKINCAIKSAQ